MLAVLAHGVGGGRADLPLPAWLFAYGAGFAVLISFVALGIFWPTPRLAAAAAGGRELAGSVESLRRPATWVLRAAGLFVFGVVLVAALWGVDDGASNISPYVLYVTFWVGLVPGLALGIAMGAVLGAWASSLMGAAIVDPVRRRFASEIEAGNVLVVIDAEESMQDELKSAMASVDARQLDYDTPSVMS